MTIKETVVAKTMAAENNFYNSKIQKHENYNIYNVNASYRFRE